MGLLFGLDFGAEKSFRVIAGKRGGNEREGICVKNLNEDRIINCERFLLDCN